MQSKNQELSTFLKQARRAKGFSQDQVAKYLGVTQSQYSKIEMEPCKSRLDYFLFLVRLLEVNQEKLVMLLF